MSSLQPAEDLRAYGLLTLGLFNMINCVLYENMYYVARNKEIMTNLENWQSIVQYGYLKYIIVITKYCFL